MKNLIRWGVVLVVLAALAGIIELCLRIFLPSLIEGGARVALRVPASESVTVETEGSLLLNALRWQIADVTVTATGAPLADEVTAATTLEIGSMPLIPTFGDLQDGSAEFTVPADGLDGIMTVMSGGMADRGEVRDGQLFTGGVLTDELLEVPYAPAFEVPFEGAVNLSVEEGNSVVVELSEVSLEGAGPFGGVIEGAMSEPRSVCFADRLPKGVLLTGIDPHADGTLVLHATLSPGLLSDPDERFRGSCAE